MIYNRKFFIFVFSIIVLNPVFVRGTELTVYQTTLGAYGDVPFWLQANRWGLVSSSQFQNMTGLTSEYTAEFGSNWNVRLFGDINVLVDAAGVTPRLHFGYGSVSWRFLDLKAGFFPEIVGSIPHPELSTGSMSVSGNARPIPKIQISSPDFVRLPFVGDFIQAKGGLAHGWFTGERWIDNTLLHEKWVYGRIGEPDGFGLHLGLVHQVMWGGVDPGTGSKPLPVSWDNYRRVFFSKGGGDDASVSDQINRAGNTVGIWDFGFEYGHGLWELKGYLHHYFEAGSSLRFRNAMDNLYGLAIDYDTRMRFIPNKITLEYLTTLDHGGGYHDVDQILDYYGCDCDLPLIVLQGRNYYYAHGTYRSGWTHHNRTLGTPLFLTIGEDEDIRVASNRVVVRHLALEGQLATQYKYQVLVTLAEHHPTIDEAKKYAPVSLVPEGRKYQQFHGLLRISHASAFGVPNLTITGALALDFGDIFESTGIEINVLFKL